MSYFFYEMSMTGEFIPVTRPTRPTKKAAGSHTPERVQIVELPTEHLGKTLHQLATIYPLDPKHQSG